MFNLLEGLITTYVSRLSLKILVNFRLYSILCFSTLPALLYHLSVPPSFHSAHHSFTFSFSQKPHTLNTSSPPLFPLRTPLSPLHSPRCICNAACTASCNGLTGAWLAEGSTSLLSARSHLTDQTSLLYDNNSSCFMTQFLSDLVFPIGVDVPQHSAFQAAFI